MYGTLTIHVASYILIIQKDIEKSLDALLLLTTCSGKTGYIVSHKHTPAVWVEFFLFKRCGLLGQHLILHTNVIIQDIQMGKPIKVLT